MEKARSLALSDRGSYCNQDKWLFKDTSHASEAVELPATSASRTKILLENIDLRGSLLARLLVPLQDFLFLAFRGMLLVNVWRTKKS